MKKIIIAAAIILTSGVTALCITKTEGKAVSAQNNIEKKEVTKVITVYQKSDIQSAE